MSTTTYETKIAILNNRSAMIYSIDEASYLYEFINEESFFNLYELVDNEDEIPKESGLYHCDIAITSERCNHPLDPEEWDMVINIINTKKIEE